jgi:hypothetical protein
MITPRDNLGVSFLEEKNMLVGFMGEGAIYLVRAKYPINWLK